MGNPVDVDDSDVVEDVELDNEDEEDELLVVELDVVLVVCELEVVELVVCEVAVDVGVTEKLRLALVKLNAEVMPVAVACTVVARLLSVPQPNCEKPPSNTFL